MAVYKSFNDLNGRTLKYDDRVVFKSGACVVEANYLHLRSSTVNHQVFDDLLVKKAHLAEEAYGYSAGRGSWPTCEPRDYEALTRLCLVLLAFEEGSQYVDLKMPNGKWKRIHYEPDMFKIGNLRGYLKNNILKVGCQKVSFEEVKKVYNAMRASRKSK